MTELLDKLNAAMPIEVQAAFFLRIAVACICGAAVGFERSKRFKEAGIRTHCMVCCTAAVFMILSKYCFADLTGGLADVFTNGASTDGARIAAQVVCGIGFLGAGVIFKHGSSIRGLTTAAGIWATSAIGMAIGAGMYLVGAFATVVVVVLQILMHKFTVGNDAYTTNAMTIIARDSKEFREWLLTRLDEWKVQIDDSSISRSDDGTTTYKLTLRTNNRLDFTTLVELMNERDEIISARFKEE